MATDLDPIARKHSRDPTSDGLQPTRYKCSSVRRSLHRPLGGRLRSQAPSTDPRRSVESRSDMVGLDLSFVVSFWSGHQPTGCSSHTGHMNSGDRPFWGAEPFSSVFSLFRVRLSIAPPRGFIDCTAATAAIRSNPRRRHRHAESPRTRASGTRGLGKQDGTSSEHGVLN